MKELIINIVCLILGIYLYAFMYGQDYASAAQNSYWLTFGSIFIYFKMVRPIKLEKERG